MAQELGGGQKSSEVFAPTPPLEAVRLLLPNAATTAARHPGQKKRILLIDVRKAHLHAESVRETYVRLPPEVAEEGMRGKLRRCLYGTRDAAARWEALYSQKLAKRGFTQGRASTCAFYIAHRDLRCVVHGDDFTFLGFSDDLDWITRQMEGWYSIKVRGRLTREPGPSRR